MQSVCAAAYVRCMGLYKRSGTKPGIRDAKVKSVSAIEVEAMRRDTIFTTVKWPRKGGFIGQSSLQLPLKKSKSYNRDFLNRGMNEVVLLLSRQLQNSFAQQNRPF